MCGLLLANTNLGGKIDDWWLHVMKDVPASAEETTPHRFDTDLRPEPGFDSREHSPLCEDDMCYWTTQLSG